MRVSFDGRFIVSDKSRVELRIDFADGQTREQADVPGIRAAHALIDTPDIEHFFLRVDPEGAGWGEILLPMTGGAALANQLIADWPDVSCNFHGEPFLTHTKADPSKTDRDFCDVKNI